MLIELTIRRAGKLFPRTISLHHITDLRPGQFTGAEVVLRSQTSTHTVSLDVEEKYEDIIASLRRANLLITV